MPNQHPLQQQADQAKAQMGLATKLQSFLLPQGQGQQVASNANPAQGSPTNQNTQSDLATQMQGLESRIFDELGTLKAEVSQITDAKTKNQELEDIKKQIQTVLDSNE